jgi:hypothetical protein
LRKRGSTIGTERLLLYRVRMPSRSVTIVFGHQSNWLTRAVPRPVDVSSPFFKRLKRADCKEEPCSSFQESL